MTHEITDARIEAVAKSLWRLSDNPTPYDITRTILEADARWVAENNLTLVNKGKQPQVPEGFDEAGC
jgi:hypothetical protein